MITEQRFALLGCSRGCPTTSGSSYDCAPDGRILGAPPTPAGCGCTPPTPTGPPAPEQNCRDRSECFCCF